MERITAFVLLGIILFIVIYLFGTMFFEISAETAFHITGSILACVVGYYLMGGFNDTPPKEVKKSKKDIEEEQDDLIRKRLGIKSIEEIKKEQEIKWNRHLDLKKEYENMKKENAKTK